jgi:phosphonate transport system substrate-binding protein
MKYLACFFYFISILLFTGCNGNNKSANGAPTTLKIGIFGGENPAETKTKTKLFQQYLEKELGVKVEFIYTTDYTTIIEALHRKKIQAAHISPFSYVIASRKTELVPLVTIGLNYEPTTFHSILITNAKSPIKSIEDLKLHAKELSIVFSDPASTSGHLIPRAFLNSIGLDADSFKAKVFAGNHAGVILSVQSGKSDIGATNNELAFKRMVEDSVIKQSDFRILWTSSPLVNDLVVIRKDVDSAFIKKYKQVLLDADQKDFAAFSGSIYRFYPHPENMQYITVEDSAYNELRRIAAGIKDLNFAK